jgi:hypothetical protein
MESRSSRCSDPPPKEDVEAFSTWSASVFFDGSNSEEWLMMMMMENADKRELLEVVEAEGGV